jgi:hypothetical protein
MSQNAEEQESGTRGSNPCELSVVERPNAATAYDNGPASGHLSSTAESLHVPQRPTVSGTDPRTGRLWTRHGVTAGGRPNGPPEYSAWTMMRQRCFNPRAKKFPDYGARGITVCDRWRCSFPNFLADMGPRAGKGYSLERVNNDGNYEPGNCKWATAKEQSNNRRPRSCWRRGS